MGSTRLAGWRWGLEKKYTRKLSCDSIHLRHPHPPHAFLTSRRNTDLIPNHPSFHLHQVALWRYPSQFGNTAAYVDAWNKLVNMSKAAGVDRLIYDLTGNGGGTGA